MNRRQFWIWADCLGAGVFIGMAANSPPLLAVIFSGLAGGTIGMAIIWIVEPFKK